MPRTLEAASTDVAREINRDLILELIRRRQPIARVDLARVSGLQNSTASSIVEQLLSEGWIREGETIKTARGRRPTQITLNDSMAMLVADVHPDQATIAGLDLNGRIFEQLTFPLPARGRDAVTRLGTELAKLKLRHPERVFTGAGVCIPGRVDTSSGRLIVAPNLLWHGLDLRESLQTRLGLNVELENDANACLLAELWFGQMDGVRNAVLLAISEGVGGALLADGHLIYGRLGLAGEFGHVSYDPQGPVCSCGRRGCWEVFTSCRAATRDYEHARTATKYGGAANAHTISYRELSGRAEAGDALAHAAIERQAVALGRGLRMVTASLAPEMILFTGEITFAWPLVLPILERECKATLLAGTCPQLVRTGEGDQTHLLGAAAVVLQRHPRYYLSRSAARVQSRTQVTPRTALSVAAPQPAAKT